MPLGTIRLPLVGVSRLQTAWGRPERSLIFWESTEVANIHNSVKCIMVKEGDSVFISIIKYYLGFYF